MAWVMIINDAANALCVPTFVVAGINSACTTSHARAAWKSTSGPKQNSSRRTWEENLPYSIPWTSRYVQCRGGGSLQHVLHGTSAHLDADLHAVDHIVDGRRRGACAGFVTIAVLVLLVPVCSRTYMATLLKTGTESPKQRHKKRPSSLVLTAFGEPPLPVPTPGVFVFVVLRAKRPTEISYEKHATCLPLHHQC